MDRTGLQRLGRVVARATLTAAETAFGALVILFLLQTFIARTYAVEQTSMVGTLLPSDRVIVDELTPRFDPYKVGDIVVFAAPEDLGRQELWIKRVIGVGGDEISLADGAVFRNGVRLDEPYTFNGEPTLPQSIARWVVPDGYLFVMGDHRRASLDSRAFGPIPLESVIGRAWMRYMPLDAVGLLTP